MGNVSLQLNVGHLAIKQTDREREGERDHAKQTYSFLSCVFCLFEIRTALFAVEAQSVLQAICSNFRYDQFSKLFWAFINANHRDQRQSSCIKKTAPVHVPFLIFPING